jgi:small-conductance mechanosensitive channel
MIEFARFVGQVFLPSVGGGVALGVLWRYVPGGRLRTALQWTASLLFFVPQPFTLFLGAYSSRLRLYQQVLLSLWGFATCALIVSRIRSCDRAATSGLFRRLTYWRQTPEEARQTEIMLSALRNRPPQSRRIVLAGAALAMATLGVWCGGTAVGDYLLTHRIVAGRVEGARVVRGTRSPTTYQVIIDHHAYNITRDLLEQLRPGEVVEVEVGVVSGTIVAIRGDVHPPQAGILRQ